jgi:hypothetical protein
VGEPALRGRGVEEVERALRGRGGRDQAGELRMVEVPRRRGGRGRRRRRKRGRAGEAVAAVLERRDPRERSLGGSGRWFHGTRRAESASLSFSGMRGRCGWRVAMAEQDLMYRISRRDPALLPPGELCPSARISSSSPALSDGLRLSRTGPSPPASPTVRPPVMAETPHRTTLLPPLSLASV